jgi:hypothetical protein
MPRHDIGRDALLLQVVRVLHLGQAGARGLVGLRRRLVAVSEDLTHGLLSPAHVYQGRG